MVMAVKNTFIHISENEERSQSGRSSSAPPACKLPSSDKPAGEIDSFASSTEASESGDISPRSAGSDHEGNSSFSTGCDSDTDISELAVDGDDESEKLHLRSRASPQQFAHPEAQQQLEQMSQTVMDIWAKLRAMESSLEAQSMEQHVTTSAQSAVVSPHMKSDAETVAIAPPPCRCTPREEMQRVLASVEESVAAVQGVASVQADLGRPGALVTLSIRLDSRASTPKLIDQTVDVAKTALSEATANSQNVFVLGYEAEPFQDVSRSVFAATLVSMPADEKCNACWQTYRTGRCPRARRCKRRHPSHNELQPIRVVVS